MGQFFAYTIADPEYFRPLSERQISTEYQLLLESLVPRDWSVLHEDIWLFASPANQPMPAHGFKIHVSAVLSTAMDVIRSVVPVCASMGVAFKIAADPVCLTILGSKGYNREGAGKFMTIYPAPEQFEPLIARVAQATAGLAGPYVLSDRRYAGSRVVFYRYGSFKRSGVVDAAGVRTSVMIGPGGTKYEDTRRPWFVLPPWVRDPFAGDRPAAEKHTVVLARRFEVLKPLAYSNSGGVYEGRDLVTDRPVVIKEARPLSACWYAGSSIVDAVARLRHEWEVLNRLAGLSCIPEPIALFTEWEHTFLVEGRAPGVPLLTFRATPGFFLGPFRPNARKVGRFCRQFKAIALALLESLRAVHDAGVVLGDLSPGNVLWDTTRKRSTFIDFEAALVRGDEATWARFSQVWATPGFRSKQQHNDGTLSTADDYYGLGMLLYSLVICVQSVFDVHGEARSSFVARVEELVSLPPEVSRIIELLSSNQPAEAHDVLTTWDPRSARRPITRRKQERGRDTEAGAERHTTRLLAGLQKFLDNTYDADSTAAPWPTDPVGYQTNPLSVGFGACGPLLFYRSLGVDPPDGVLQRLLRQKLDPARIPPGLYVGASGVAWTLLEYGYVRDAAAILSNASSSDLLRQDSSVFQGIAGWGSACMRCYGSTGDQTFLNHACDAGDWLLHAAVLTPDGLSWPQPNTGKVSFGFAFGSSGIALFLLELYLVTHEHRFLPAAEGALSFDVSKAVITRGTALEWTRDEHDSIMLPYWLYGSAGVGSALIRFFAALKKPEYGDLSIRAAEGAFHLLSVMPGQFEGLSGIGEFMMDMWQFTGRREYYKRALEIAKSIECYVDERPNGEMRVPGRLLLRFSSEFAHGAAGVGIFLARVRNRSSRLLYNDAILKVPSSDRCQVTPS